MTDGIMYVTPEGLAKIQEELHQLRSVKRREIADKIERAKELGDLSENAEYHEAKDEQAFIEGRILELEQVMNTAEVVQRARGGERVRIGSTVRVQFNGAAKTFEIVGVNESEPIHGKISHESPIGRALIGHTVDDAFDVDTPSGKKQCRVLGIE